MKSKALVVASLLLCSCTTYHVRVETDASPGLSPAKADPVVLQLPQNPSTDERLMLPLVQHELSKNGFNAVDSVSQATWVLVLTTGSDTSAVGSSSRGGSLPAGSTAVGKLQTTIDYQADVAVGLSLYRASDFASGDASPVWDGIAIAPKKIFAVYKNAVVKDLLDSYGTSNSGSLGLSRDYQRSSR